MSILDLLKTEPLDPVKIHAYLSDLFFDLDPDRSLSGSDRSESKKAWEDGSVFAVAKQRDNLRLFQLLLDFDLTIPVNFDKKGLSRENISLLDTRAAWQREMQIAKDMPFCRTTKLVELTISAATTQAGEGVILFGKTGSGKSTLCNYQLGVDYEKKGFNNVSIKKGCLQPEVAIRGETVVSKTLFPATYPVRGKPWQLVDMAGVEETRGPEFEISAAVMMKLFMDKMGKVRSLLLVLPAYSFQDPRILDYRAVALKAGRMLLKKPELGQHVLLAITKLGTDITADNIKECLENLLASENLEPALKLITKVLVHSLEDRTTLLDVTQAIARESLTNAIDKLSSSPQEEFDFSNYHESVDQYRSNMAFLKEKNRLLHIEYKDQKKIDEAQQREIARWRNHSKIVEGASTIDQRIQDTHDHSEELAAILQTKENRLSLLQEQGLRITQRLDKLSRQKTIIETSPHHEHILQRHTVTVLRWERLNVENTQQLDSIRKTIVSTKTALEFCNSALETLTQEKAQIEASKTLVAEDIENLIEAASRLSQAAKLRWQEAQFILDINKDFFKWVDDIAKQACLGIDLLEGADLDEQPLKADITTAKTEMTTIPGVAFFQNRPPVPHNIGYLTTVESLVSA